ncbi:6-phospho-3-hexuloisomerase [Paenibacillus validus]|uniref:6-phospho-3-hexuloisomerase n=1 Tax=Paenibacillus TaxID=44249 RepID=UPI000FDCCB37|nr:MULTISPECIES: 6-phospho-3-hexuloisomerase [Paenibacillus]MED4600409.1 6-phospho-3-hexuloisomerase [Paenibacillus validus]MED4607872.1 6-phospho-3-hexuloisomerase [Paenibacillus validus]
MSTSYLAEIIKELNRTADFVADREVEDLVDRILQSKKVFVAGAGRSGLMVRAFAMRMMQMGIEAYVVGETVTPNLEKGDTLIIGSGSGETRTLIPVAEKAKSLGGSVAVITISPESTLGKLSDITVKMPGSPKEQEGSAYQTIQPMGALFEQSLLLVCDAVILKMMEKQGLDSRTMFGRHANLE